MGFSVVLVRFWSVLTDWCQILQVAFRLVIQHENVVRRLVDGHHYFCSLCLCVWQHAHLNPGGQSDGEQRESGTDTTLTTLQITAVQIPLHYIGP